MDKKVFDYIKDCIENGKCANIVIAGCSCSGKTTLANEIERELSSICVCSIHQDDFFKDLNDIPKGSVGVLADSIHAFHTDKFIDCCTRLLEDGQAYVPVYDMSKNQYSGHDSIRFKGAVNIFEGLHAISLLKGRMDAIFIFMGTEEDECLKRRKKRDMDVWRIKEDSVEKYWKGCIEPMNKQYVMPQYDMADIIM